jgi:hypothetical protein
MGLFEFVANEYAVDVGHNSNTNYQVYQKLLQMDQQIRLQYSHQINLLQNIPLIFILINLWLFQHLPLL